MLASSGNWRLLVPTLLHTPERPPFSLAFLLPTINTISSDSLRLAPVCWETYTIKCSEKTLTSSNFIKEGCGQD